MGRLPGGARIDQVASRAEVISSRLETAYPDTNRNRRFTLTALGEGRGLRVATRPMLRQLAGAVAYSIERGQIVREVIDIRVGQRF